MLPVIVTISVFCEEALKVVNAKTRSKAKRAMRFCFIVPP
jgi:hypothetical protein